MAPAASPIEAFDDGVPSVDELGVFSDTPLAAVEYELLTDWEGIEALDGKRSWTTALGYDVELDQWALLTNSAELIPCESPGFGLWTVAHTTYAHDPSVAEAGYHEDLVSAPWWQFGPGPLTAVEYCEVLTIHGYGIGDEVGHLSGRYRSPNSGDWVEFDAENPVGLTALLPLGVPVPDDTLPEATARLTLMRYPVRALDALDFDALTPLELAYDATRTVVRDSEVVVQFPAY